MDKTTSKLIKFILWIIAIVIATYVILWMFSISVGIGFLKGISDKSKEGNKIITEQVNDGNIIKESNSSKDTSNVNKATSKEQYYNQFEKINTKVEKINKNSNGSTSQLVENSKEIYNLWDEELNLIYNNLKETLPSSEFKILEKKQIKWIDYKENIGEQVYDSYNDDDNANIEKFNSLASLTKEKCEELVNEYA